MYRKVIVDGDLMLMHRPWYSFGKYTPYRNLSEEVRCLNELTEKAMTKYKELQHSYVVASTNVAAELETLQILLLENSEAYFDVSVDNSILDKREGLRYNFNRGGNNNKKGTSSGGGSSSNKEQNQNNQQKQNQNNQGKPKGIPVSKLLGASIVLH